MVLCGERGRRKRFRLLYFHHSRPGILHPPCQSHFEHRGAHLRRDEPERHGDGRGIRVAALRRAGLGAFHAVALLRGGRRADGGAAQPERQHILQVSALLHFSFGTDVLR